MSDRPKSALLIGKQCYLRPLERADLSGNWRYWFSDTEVTRFMFRGVFPISIEESTAFYEQLASEQQNDLVLAVIARDGDVHVGNVGLHRIDWINRSAEFGIVIGERDHQGKGIGTEATRLIVEHGFERLNLHRIWLGVFADHVSAIRMYARIGFREEGRLLEAILRDGKAHDQLIMGLLAEEFRNKELR